MITMLGFIILKNMSLKRWQLNLQYEATAESLPLGKAKPQLGVHMETLQPDMQTQSSQKHTGKH